MPTEYKSEFISFIETVLSRGKRTSYSSYQQYNPIVSHWTSKNLSAAKQLLKPIKCYSPPHTITGKWDDLEATAIWSLKSTSAFNNSTFELHIQQAYLHKKVWPQLEKSKYWVCCGIASEHHLWETHYITYAYNKSFPQLLFFFFFVLLPPNTLNGRSPYPRQSCTKPQCSINWHLMWNCCHIKLA